MPDPVGIGCPDGGATFEGSFQLLAGAPKAYVKIGESGNSRELAFCRDYGQPVYCAPAADGVNVIALRVGTIRQRDRLIPSDQYWFRSSQAWLEFQATMRKREARPDFDVKGDFGNRRQNSCM